MERLSTSSQPHTRTPLEAKSLTGCREYLWLVGVLVVVTLVHIASFLYLSNLSAGNPQGPHYPIVPGDSSYYVRMAGNMLAYHAYTDSVPDLAPNDANPPLYPFLLAVTKSLTGSFTPIVLLQMLFALVGVVLIYAIARKYVPRGVALVPAFLYGIEPMAVLANSTMLTDGLFTAILLMLVYVGFVQEKLRGFPRAIFVGLLLGILAMLRPTGMLLAPIVLVFFVVQEWMQARHARIRKAAIALAIALVYVGALTVPWIMRNGTQIGRYELFHSGTHAFLDYNIRYFLAWRELRKDGEVSVYYPARHLQDPVFAVVDARIKIALAEITPPGVDPEDYVGKLSARSILHDPIRYAYFHLMHLPVFFLASGIGAYEQVVMQIRGDDMGASPSTMYKTIAAMRDLAHPDRILPALATAVPILFEVAFWCGVFLLALIGLFLERRRLEAWLYAALIGYFAVIVGAFTVARYRIPTEPFLLILASIGAHMIGSRALAAYRAGKEAGGRVPGFARFLEIVRYIISGTSALLVSLIIYSILVFGFGTGYIAASVIAFLAAFVVSFVLQKFFAFRDQTPPKHGQQIGAYTLLLLFNIAANTLMLMFFVGYVGMGKFMGLFLANALVALWNFFIYERILFTEREIHIEPSPARLRGSLADLSVVIPCHNEEGAIGSVLDAIPKGVGEIIIVDNNCTDDTARIARERGARVVKEMRPGTGAAMRAGFSAAKGKIIAVIDGDNQHPAGELPRILHQLEEERADFISAARFPLSESWLRGFGNWGLTLVANVLFGLSLSDSQTGMVMFRRDLLPCIEGEQDGPAFVQEFKIRAATAPGVRFAECRIPCISRTNGVSKLLPMRHGVKLLWVLLRMRLK